MRHQRWLDKMTALVQECGTLAHAVVEVVADRKRVEVPTVRLTLDEESAGLSALELVRALEEGMPSIAANPTYVQEGVVVFGPMCLRSGEESAIAARLRALLGA